MNEVKDLFVSYEIALKLKEKGFDELCMAYFNRKPYVTPPTGAVPASELFIHRNTFLHDTKSGLVLSPEENFSKEWRNKRGGVVRSKWGIKVAAPMYQQVIDWFREKHSIYINVNPLGVYVNSDKSKLMKFMHEGKYSGTLDNVTTNQEMYTTDTIELIETGNTYYEALENGIKQALELI